MFSGLANVTVNTSANGASQYIQLSAPAPGGGAGVTVSEWSPINSSQLTNAQLVNNSVYVQPFDLDCYVYAYRLNMFMSIATTLSATNTGDGGHTFQVMLYSKPTNSTGQINSFWSCTAAQRITKNNSTQIVATNIVGISNSTAVSTVTTALSTSNATTYVANSMAGFRVLHFPVSSTLSPGRYWLAVHYSALSTHASCIIRASILQQNNPGHVAYRPFGTSSAASNATSYGVLPGLGIFWVTTQNPPASIPLTTTGGVSIVVGNNVLPYFNLSGYTTGTNFV
jgi:hypothetical protein